MALPPIRIAIETQGVDQARGKIERMGDEVRRTGEAGRDAAGGVREAGAALDDLGTQAQSAGADVRGASAAAEQMAARFERLRNIGAVITGIGAGALMLSGHLREVAQEGNAVEARLEGILKAQGRLGELDAQNAIIQDVTVRGHFADDDEIRNAAVLLDSFSVSTEHMGELLENAARQARTMGTEVGGVAEQLGKAYNSGNVGMLKKSGITVSQEEIDRIKEAYAVSQKLGQQTFVDVLGPAIRANTAALEDSLTEAQKATNDAARAFDDFKTTVGTGSADAHAAIQRGVITPLLEIANAHPGLLHTAGGVLEIGGSIAAIGGPMLGLAGQIGMARLGFAGMGTAAVTAFWSAAAAALTAAPAIWAAIAPLLPLILAIAAGVLLVVAGLYLWAKADLDKAAADKKQADAKDKEFFETQKARLDSGKTSDVKAGETLADWQKRKGRGAENSEDVSGGPDTDALIDLKGQLDAAKDGTPAAPAMPSAPAMPDAPPASVGGAEFPVSNAMGGAVTNGVPDNNPYADQIRELTRQKRDLKGKEHAAARDALTAQIDELKDSERAWKTASAAQKKGDKEASKRADKEAKSAAEIEKIEATATADAQIAALQTQLDTARESKNSARVESLTLQIELAKAAKDREAAMRDAVLVQDGAERGDAARVIGARFEAARQAARRTARKAGEDAERALVKHLQEVENRGETRLQKIASKGRYADYIGDLEDQLAGARDDKDAAQVEALTLQIELARAEESRQDALIDAAGIRDEAERSYTLDAIQGEFDLAASAARRSARRARRDAEKGGEGIGDAAIRSQLAMMNAARPNIGAFPALGANFNAGAGDRFAEADALRPDYAAAMAPMDWAAIARDSQPQRAGDAGNSGNSGGGGKRRAEFDVEAESYRQNARGDIEVQLKGGVITIPNQGIGTLRGRVGGRR